MFMFENYCPRIGEDAGGGGKRGVRSLMKPLLSVSETISPVLASAQHCLSSQTDFPNEELSP